MKHEDKIEAIREILALGEEGMVSINAKVLFERMKAAEKRIIVLFEDEPLTLSDVRRLSSTHNPGGFIKKAFKGLEELGLIREIYRKGISKPYELTERGKQFRRAVETS